MVKLSHTEPDDDRAQAGVRVHYRDGIWLRIAHIGNAAYRRAQFDAFRPHRRRMRAGEMPLEEIAKIETRLIAEHVLVGWENVDDEAGKPQPYTVDAGVEALTKFPRLRDFVLDEARDFDNYRAEEEEDALGNSLAASSGSSPGGIASSK